MEYLISRGFRHVAKESIHGLLENTTFRSQDPCFVQQHDDFFVFSNASPSQSKHPTGRCYLFDGQVFHNDEFLHPLLSPEEDQLASLYATMEQGCWDSASGVFTVLQLDFQAKCFTVYVDPLSQYPVLYWQQGHRYLVSNNALLIESFLSSRGYDLQRNPACLLAAVANMNLYGSAPFQNLHYMPPRCRLRARDTLSFEPTMSVLDLCTAPMSYEEHIHACAQRIQQRCHSLIDPLPEHYFLTDITGGIDSRLVLSALLANGQQDRIAAWCNTKYPHPDANVADYLIDRYQLKNGRLLLNWNNELLHLEERIKRGLFRNRGARYRDWHSLGTGYFPRLVRLGGALGELGRSNVYVQSFNNPGVPNQGLAKDVGRLGLASGEYHFLQSAGVEQLSTTLQGYIDGLLSQGVSRENLSDILYLDGRGRYHFSQQLACSSMAYIAPTLNYDLHLVWANSHLSMQQRIAGKAQFDLMSLLASEDLMNVPMADKRWGSDAVPVSQRGHFSQIDIVSRSSEPLSHGAESMQWEFCWPMDDARLEPPVPPSEWTRGRSHVWLQLQRNQRMLGQLLDHLDTNDEFFELFDREALVSIASIEPDSIQQNALVANLSTMVGGLMWHLGLEDRVQLKDKYEGPYPN